MFGTTEEMLDYIYEDAYENGPMEFPRWSTTANQRRTLASGVRGRRQALRGVSAADDFLTYVMEAMAEADDAQSLQICLLDTAGYALAMAKAIEASLADKVDRSAPDGTSVDNLPAVDDEAPQEATERA